MNCGRGTDDQVTGVRHQSHEFHRVQSWIERSRSSSNGARLRADTPPGMAKASEIGPAIPASGRFALTLMRHISADQASSPKFLYEAETLPVLDAVGIKDAVEVIAFVLDDARMKALRLTIDLPPVRIQSAIADTRIAGNPAAHAGHAQASLVPSIYSIVPPNDGSALRHGHHFEPVDFVIKTMGAVVTMLIPPDRASEPMQGHCGCRQRPRRHREELIESERGWSGREAFVTMMQTADLGQGNDRSGPGRLNGSTIRWALSR